jgi:hypothetical protein
MEYNFKNMFKRRFVAFLLILSVISSTSYLPVFASRAQAFPGIPNINLESLPTIADYILDAIAMPIAQKMVEDMVKETVDWANSGFEGGPAYVTDTGQFLTNTADDVAGEFIAGNDLGFLCSPFQANIRLSLVNQYYQPTQKQFQCTLSGVTDNIEGFFNGDFNGGGGWDTWFAVTQSPTNNPYGAFLEARGELDQRLATKIGLSQNELLVNQGFLSFKDCLEHNPSQAVIDGVEKYKLNANAGAKNGMVLNKVRASGLSNVENEVLDIIENKRKYDPTKPADACIQDGPIKTAGTTIKSQLDNVLGSGLSQLISVENWQQLVGAFASGLLKRYVFSDKGTFASDSKNAPSRELYDVDKDDIPDGWDTNADFNLDICNFGTKDSTKDPSNENCILSKGIASSPYFAPLCDNLGKATYALENYFEFTTGMKFAEFNSRYSVVWRGFGKNSEDKVNDYLRSPAASRVKYDSALENLWFDKTSVSNDAVDNLISTFGKLGIERAYLDAMKNLGTYENWVEDKVLDSLAKSDFSLTGQVKLVRQLGPTLDYLIRFRETLGRCDAPDTNALENLPPPEFIDDGGTFATTTGDTNLETEPQ